MDVAGTQNVPLIAHVVVNLDVGGLENGLVNLANAIPPDRYRQAIVCLKQFTDFRKRLARSETEVIAVHKREGKDIPAYLRLWRTLRHMKPCIVHTRNLGTIDVGIVAKLAGIPHVVHGEHGWDVTDESGTNKRHRLLRRTCRPFIDRQITVSRHIEHWLTDSVGVPSSAVRQIYNGVDALKFRPPAAGRDGVPHHPSFAPPGSFVIGTVSRMASIKDPLALVRAFQTVTQAVGLARVRLMMVGDGPLFADVKQALAAAGLGDVTWLPGKRDDIDALMRAMDLFVLPSRNEGISNTILEAMASGLPVVANNVGGNPELVIPGKTGALVSPQNSEAMAAAIRQYVENLAMAKEHGLAGRRRVLEEFTIDGMVSRYLDVYDSLSYGRPGTV
jgi:sugar transferase (PEP-CTERM/EpsH1 system associated)